MTASAVRQFYARLGITLHRSGGREAPARCFAFPAAHRHEDRHPSVSVNLDSGAWLCHGCGARGGAYDAALLQGHTARSAMDLLISHGLAEPRRHTSQPTPSPKAPGPPSIRPRPVPPSLAVGTPQIDAWHERLLARADLVERLARERGISTEVLVRFAVGFDGKRVVIPIRAVDATLTGALRWLPFNRASAPKMLAIAGTRRDLFPAPEQLPVGSILICEGEPDALAAHTAGIPAVAIPGVAAWRTRWATRFTGRDVTIALDCDLEGRACAARITRDLATVGIGASVVDLAPERGDGYDLTDHLLAGGSIDPLRG